MIERISLALLLIVTGLMAVNLYVLSDRFGEAAQSYDELRFAMASFSYYGVEEPVEFGLTYHNNSGSEIQVMAIEFSLTANGVSVGGNDQRFELQLDPESEETTLFPGRIIDRNAMERAEDPDGISWVIIGRSLVQVNGDLEPVWLDFGFRAET